MNDGSGSFLIATPGEQHADAFLLCCLLAGMEPPEGELKQATQKLIIVSGAGPDRVVDRLLRAARCGTFADVVERLAPERFRVQEVQTSWDDSPFWMLGDEPIERIVMLGCDGTAFAQVATLARDRAVPFAASQSPGSRLDLLLGRRDGGLLNEVSFAQGASRVVGVPHIGIAAVAAGQLACWLSDLDVRGDFMTDRHVSLDLARPGAASMTSADALADLPTGANIALISAGGLMSNVALLLASASSELAGILVDDDAFTSDQWRYWVIRLFGELAGPKVERTAQVMNAINAVARIEPQAVRVHRSNVDVLLPQGPFHAAVTTPDNDVCRSATADHLSLQITEAGSPVAHALGGARDFGAEAYVETVDTASADSVLLLSDRAEAEQEAGVIEPTSCADPRAEAGVVICNLIAAGLLTTELCRILNGQTATGRLSRYSLNRNTIRVHGPFARATQEKGVEVRT